MKPSFVDLPFTHLSEVDKKVLVRLASELPSNSICLEVGSYLGASALLIASCLAEGGRIYCVDTWQNDGMSEGKRDTFAEFINNTSRFSDRILALRGVSASMARDFSGQIDLLFIDGDHSYEGCKADFDAWVPKVRLGGLVLFHDALWADGVKKVIREDFLPLLQDFGSLEGNIFYGRKGFLTGVDARDSRKEMSLQTAVISSRRPRADEVAGSFAEATNSDRDLLWILAGSNCQGDREDGRSSSSNVSIVSAGQVGLVAGRHKALEVCDSDVVIYLDDDVILPDGWQEKMLKPFENADVHFVGCRYLPNYEEEPPSWLKDLWVEQDGFRIFTHLSLLDGGTTGRVYSPLYVWGLCFAVRRQTVLNLGGFHPDGYPWELRRYRGDGETGLSIKANTLGLKAYYQGETYVMHQVPAARMTPQYFERRAFIQGISDSYTQVRRNCALQPAPAPHWKNLLRIVKRRLERASLLRNPSSQGVRLLMRRAYTAGFRYHQEEVRRDPKLLDWVLKPNYLDCRLPEGWEKYLH